jgi:hypothetical protein
MPLEGHWERQNTPLRRTTVRERRLLAIVGALVAAATVGLVVYLLVAGGHSSASTGCVDVTAAHATGGARIHACGRGATRLCGMAASENTPLARGLRPQCRRNRVPTTPGAAAP